MSERCEALFLKFLAFLRTERLAQRLLFQSGSQRLPECGVLWISGKHELRQQEAPQSQAPRSGVHGIVLRAEFQRPLSQINAGEL